MTKRSYCGLLMVAVLMFAVGPAHPAGMPGSDFNNRRAFSHTEFWTWDPLRGVYDLTRVLKVTVVENIGLAFDMVNQGNRSKWSVYNLVRSGLRTAMFHSIQNMFISAPRGKPMAGPQCFTNYFAGTFKFREPGYSSGSAKIVRSDRLINRVTCAATVRVYNDTAGPVKWREYRGKNVLGLDDYRSFWVGGGEEVDVTPSYVDPQTGLAVCSLSRAPTPW